MAGGNAVPREALRRKVDELEAELAGEGAGPLEKLLASNVALAWLSANEAETAAAAAREASPPRAEYLDRRRDRARKRLEGAARTLAVVRKLLRPAPAPIEVATRLGRGRGGPAAAARARQNVPCGAGVAN
jgi:hypothetical protein